jgi:hypothetical protein
MNVGMYATFVLRFTSTDPGVPDCGVSTRYPPVTPGNGGKLTNRQNGALDPFPFSGRRDPSHASYERFTRRVETST